MGQLANNIQKYSNINNTEVTKSNERVSTTETKNYNSRKIINSVKSRPPIRQNRHSHRDYS